MENFIRELKFVKKKKKANRKTENTIPEIKNFMERFNSRLVIDRISNLKDRFLENTQTEPKRKNNILICMCFY